MSGIELASFSFVQVTTVITGVTSFVVWITFAEARRRRSAE